METAITRAEYDEYKRRIEDEHKRTNKRIGEIEEVVEKIYDLSASIQKLATSVEQLTKAQESQSDRLKNLEGRDGEKWRSVVQTIISMAVGAIVTYIFKSIGF